MHQITCRYRKVCWRPTVTLLLTPLHRQKDMYRDSSYVIAKDFTMTPKNTTHVIRDMPWKAKQKINIMKSASHAYI